LNKNLKYFGKCTFGSKIIKFKITGIYGNPMLDFSNEVLNAEK
jgi:hypothetical protein